MKNYDILYNYNRMIPSLHYSVLFSQKNYLWLLNRSQLWSSSIFNGLNQNCLHFKEHLKSSATIMQYRVNMLIYVVNLVRLIVLIYLARQVAPDQFFLAVFHFFYTAQLSHGITFTFLPKSQPYTDENYGEIKQISHHNSRNYSMDAMDGFKMCTVEITWLRKNQSRDIGL